MYNNIFFFFEVYIFFFLWIFIIYRNEKDVTASLRFQDKP